MKILNLGSLNFDKVYEVPHFVSAGETILGEGYGEFFGGKGLNQSIALARAGATVFHVGAVGPDGKPLRNCLAENGVDVRHLKTVETVSGHAIIQNAQGQNCIIVCGGANRCVTQADICDAIACFEPGDILLLQNEMPNISAAIREAKRCGMKVVFNASPITQEMQSYPLKLVDCFIVNEVEGKALAETDSENYEDILSAMAARFPAAQIVLTIGDKGVLYQEGNERKSHPCYRVPVVDTTAAGDTFCGYYLAGLTAGKTVDQALKEASMAAAIAVSRNGASPSIPVRMEVEEFAGQCR